MKKSLPSFGYCGTLHRRSYIHTLNLLLSTFESSVKFLDASKHSSFSCMHAGALQLSTFRNATSHHDESSTVLTSA